jgi:putative intracellular protease/amidase
MKGVKMSKGTILLIASSADKFELREDKVIPAGFFLNELAIPIMAALEAGYDFVLATPKGTVPVVDERSRDPSHFGNDGKAFRAAVSFVDNDPRMQNPRSLRSVIDDGLDGYVGMFVPGGHPPMVDLMQDPDVGEILRHFHETSKPTALLCHGPAALAASVPQTKAFYAAMEDGDMDAAKAAAKGWQYAGYRMTVFSNKEEAFVEETIHGRLKFYARDALATAGGMLLTNEGIFEPNVVEDRELITGQNPPSDRALTELFLKALDRQAARAKAAA